MLLLLSSLASAQVCENDLSQDLNCNGIEAVDEEAVDLSDPLCLSTTDSEGNPLPNADYYAEYKSFGCLYPMYMDLDGDGVLDPRDLDGDGLIGANGLYTHLISTEGGLTITLNCDNCEGIPNSLSLIHI